MLRILLCPIVALCASLAHAQAFPGKPIRIVVPYPPGGSGTIIARILGDKLTQAWGQQILVDSRPGASGMIGAELVAKSAPDGYTLLAGYTSEVAINVSLFKKMAYDPLKDFAPVALTGIVPMILLVHPSVPVKSVKDLVAYAKANPGKTNFGSGSNGSAGHLAGELFKLETGTDVMHIPYKGGAPALQALLAGDTQFMFDNLASALPNIKAGKVRALAVTSAKRTSFLPDLPTLDEAGLKGFDMTTWWGVMAPAKTPRAVVDKLSDEILQAMAAPDVQERLRAMGSEMPAVRTPAQFTAFVERERHIYAALVKRSGATAD